MSYTYKKDTHSPTHITFNVTIDYANFEKEKDKVYYKLAENVEIKGFRKGQAPRHLVEPTILTELIERSLSNIVSRTTKEIIDKENLIPASIVDYKDVKIDKEKGITYSATLYAYQDFNLPDITTVKYKMPSLDAPEKEIKESIEHLINDWNKKNPKEKITYEQIEKDEKALKNWITKVKIEGVKTFKELQELVKKEIIKFKKHNSVNNILNQVVEGCVRQIKVQVPENIIEKGLEEKARQLDQQLQKLKTTKAKYLESNKLSEKELTKKWKEELEKEVKASLFFSKYRKENDIKLEIPPLDDQIKKDQQKMQQIYSYFNQILAQMTIEYMWNKLAEKEPKLHEIYKPKTKVTNEKNKENSGSKE